MDGPLNSDRPTGAKAPTETGTAPNNGSEAKELILVRFSGDITTKADATRKRFVTRLVSNIRAALKAQGVSYRIERTHNRLFVHVDGQGHVETLRHVFGVQSIARVEVRPWRTMDDIVEAGRLLFSEAVRDKRFAVRTRRVGERKRIAVISGDIDRELGRLLDEGARCVDLSTPEVTAHIEVMPGRAFFYSEQIRCEAGLPLGCEGRAVALVSGGFDSPVAAWSLMKRGVALDYVFCNLGGRTHQLETLEVMKVVADNWAHGTRPRFHAIEFEDVSAEIQARTETRYWQVILKRMMFRAAHAVAQERDALAIVTGEAVGQVSSQTLQNLAVISEVTSLPILRPLIAFNKTEIIQLAEHIGTHDLSKRVGEYCALVPSKPATRAKLEEVQREEAKMDLDLVDHAIAERTIFEIRSLDLARMEAPELQADRVEAGIVVIDLRSKPAFERWHYPDALLLEFSDAMRAYPHFDKGQRYLVYCEFGLKSAHLADRMRRGGLSAQHFSGGDRALRAWSESDAKR